MFKAIQFNRLVAMPATALLCCCVAQGVQAHAGFKDAITEGTASTWNAITITHGCNTNVGGEGNGKPHKDVIAMSAVFPNATSFDKVILRKSSGTVPAQTGANIGHITDAGTNTVGDETVVTDLSEHITNAGVKGATGATPLPLSITTAMAGGTLFINNLPIADSNGTVRGWQSWNGPKPFSGPALLESAKKPDGSDISTTGLAPFRVNGFQFKKTSCVKTLKVRVAVANWCSKGNSSMNKDGTPKEDAVDVWSIQTPLFNAPATMPNAVATGSDRGAIFWTTLTVNRDLETNPLPGTIGKKIDPNTQLPYQGDTSVHLTCAGEPDTVYIEPTAADIDENLPVSAEKFPHGAGEKYWPLKP